MSIEQRRLHWSPAGLLAGCFAPCSGPGLTPELRYRTRMPTVGSHQHRHPQGIMRLRAAWRRVSWQRPDAAVTATGTALLLCPGQASRYRTLVGRRSNALLLRLAAGEASGYVLHERLR